MDTQRGPGALSSSVCNSLWEKLKDIQSFHCLTVLWDQAGNGHGDGISPAAGGLCRSKLTADYGFKSVGAKLKAEFQPVFESCLSSGETGAAAHSPAACDLPGAVSSPGTIGR